MDVFNSRVGGILVVAFKLLHDLDVQCVKRTELAPTE